MNFKDFMVNYSWLIIFDFEILGRHYKNFARFILSFMFEILSNVNAEIVKSKIRKICRGAIRARTRKQRTKPAMSHVVM